MVPSPTWKWYAQFIPNSHQWQAERAKKALVFSIIVWILCLLLLSGAIFVEQQLLAKH